MTKYDLKNSNLFKPIKVGDLTLSTRAALAPLTRNRTAENHVPSTDVTPEYYAQRAQRAGTLLISEAALISTKYGGTFNPPGIFTKAQQDAWSKITEAVHEKKSFIFIQLWSGGLLSDPARLASEGLKYLSPSDDIYFNEQQKEAAVQANNRSHGLDIYEIKDLIQSFVQAAINSIAAGADGVEIHSANGYLLNEFLYEFINKRGDKYGGSIENRARLILEIVDGIGTEIGFSKVGLRFSPYFQLDGKRTFESSTIALYAYLLSELEKRRLEGKEIAYLSIVEPRTYRQDNETGFPDDNEWVYQIYGGVIIRAGNYSLLWEKTKLDVNANDRTIIAFGRHFISNPDLIDKIENDLSLSDYDRSTFYTAGPKGYVDYPAYDK